MTITANDLQQTLTKEITKSGVEAKSGNLSGNEKIAVYAVKEVINSSGDRFQKLVSSEVNDFVLALNNILFTGWEQNKGGPGIAFANKSAARNYAERLAKGEANDKAQAWIDMYMDKEFGGRKIGIDPNSPITGTGSPSQNIGAFAIRNLVDLPDSVNGFQTMLEKALPKGNPILSIFAGSNGNFSINFSQLSKSLSNISGVSQRLGELQKEYSNLTPAERKDKFAAILAKSTIGVGNSNKAERTFDLTLKTDILLSELFTDQTMRSNIKSALNLEDKIILKNMGLAGTSFDLDKEKKPDLTTYEILNKVFNNQQTNKNHPEYGKRSETSISVNTGFQEINLSFLGSSIQISGLQGNQINVSNV